MPTLSTLLLFVAAAGVLVFLPGPNTLYIIARSVQQGRLAGIVSSLGVQTGTLVHIAAAALGLSALLVSSALAFNSVRYVGAAYLLYLGIKTLRTQEKIEQPAGTAVRNLRTAYYQGVVVNVLNPKSGLFVLAFLPQFIDPHRGSAPIQILILGGIMLILGACSDSIYAFLAGTIGRALRENLKFLRAHRYFAGGVYIALGGLTALTGYKTPN
jgi:threonine/homoserine/homoserine lactone efflux protein